MCSIAPHALDHESLLVLLLTLGLGQPQEVESREIKAHTRALSCVRACRYCEAWLAYASMEQGLRNLREARNVFKRAYSRRLEEGGQTLLCTEWLRFEREEGR